MILMRQEAAYQGAKSRAYLTKVSGNLLFSARDKSNCMTRVQIKEVGQNMKVEFSI